MWCVVCSLYQFIEATNWANLLKTHIDFRSQKKCKQDNLFLGMRATLKLRASKSHNNPHQETRWDDMTTASKVILMSSWHVIIWVRAAHCLRNPKIILRLNVLIVAQYNASQSFLALHRVHTSVEIQRCDDRQEKFIFVNLLLFIPEWIQLKLPCSIFNLIFSFPKRNQLILSKKRSIQCLFFSASWFIGLFCKASG